MVNLLYHLYSTDRRYCLLHLMKQNYLLKTFLRTLVFMTLVSLYLFLLNLKQHNISITPKMVKGHTDLDSSKASGPDCIPVVVLKNCKLCISWTLQYLPKGVLFSRLLEGLIGGLYVGERSTAKNYCPVSLLSVLSKVFEELVNNRIVDHLEKSGLCWFPLWF